MMQSSLDNLRELCTMPVAKSCLAGAATWALSMTGHPNSAAAMLLSLLICDFALGFSRAWVSHTLRGARIVRGAFKFFRYWMAVVVFVLADGAIEKAFGNFMPVSVSDAFIAYLAINEAFSCVDHLAFFGMPVPEPFLKRLRSYRTACLAGEWPGGGRRTGCARDEHGGD